MSSIKGKTVVITGASRGIGEAAAHHFAASGAYVILAARNAKAVERIAADLRAEGQHAKAFQCDVSVANDVARLVQTTIKETGRLDVLINNAGVIDPIARLADSDVTAWGDVVDINLKGVYYGMRFAIPEMVARSSGTIINLSSGAATSALEGWSHYCTTKAAVLSLTRVGDREYRDAGLRIVGLSPGTVATEMQTKIKASGINPVSKLGPDAHIPPEWVARALVWLTEPESDPYLGNDFSLKTEEGRALVGLEPV